MKSIPFSTTVTKKQAVSPAHKPPVQPKPQERRIPVPPKKAAQKPPAPPQGQIVRPPINQDAFFRFPITEVIYMKKEKPAVPPVPTHIAPPSTPTPQLRTYAALKTAKMQHEQILSRIGK